MHEFFSREPDPIEAMLRPPSPPENEPLRQEVYTQTRHLLHRRRRLRQFAYAASLLVSFAAGALATWMALPARSASKGTPLPAPVANKETPTKEEDLVKTPALDAEWIAFDSADHRSELYRQAGDRYIKEENDLQSALRCYSNALDNATEQDLAISPDDNWLLMAIKDARQKENKYAKQGS
jgi:hypothetical protein